ncbi:MAG: hypothetical protein EU533_00740, partial [Promethearchaeota archaeon]
MKTYNKKNKKKILRFLALGLLLCGLLEILSPLIQFNISNKQEVNQYQEPQFKGAYYSNSMTPIAIDGDATGFNAHNWSWAVKQPWCSGSGTEIDPYVIANLTIDGMGSTYCIDITRSSEYFLIENCTLFNATSGWGIHLSLTEYGKITRNKIFSNDRGIELLYSYNIEISENNCFLNKWFGIDLQWSEYNEILANNCSSNGYSGIRLYFTSNYNKILENKCSLNSVFGIELYNEDNHNEISDNNCFSNGGSGIRLLDSDDNQISGNDCNLNDDYGIRLETSSENNRISENDFSYNTRGIMVYTSSNNNTISRNICNSNVLTGIYLEESSNNNTILKNDCSSNTYGIIISFSSYNDVLENICNLNDFGIVLLSSTHNTISEHEINSNEYGIYTESSAHNTISRNNLNSNDYGIYIESSSDHNTIYKNYFTMNDENALDDGTDNYWDNGIIGNYWDDYIGSDADLDGIGDDPYMIAGLGGGIDHYSIWFFYNLKPILIDGDATGVSAHNWTWASYQPWCTGKGTWNNPYIISDVIIDGQGTDNCIEIQNSNVPFIIRNSTLYNASPLDYKAAIHLDHVNNSLILENNCSNNGHIGIILYENCNNNTIKGNIMHENQNAAISIRVSSENNIIIDNWIANSTGNFAIYLLNSNYNSFSNNTIQGCLTGIRIHATEHTTVMSNNFESNQIGISLRHGHYSIITKNIIRDSWNFGIRSEQTAFCEIHDNLFYNTTYDGIRLLDNCRYNEIYSNEIQKSSRYGVNLDDANVHNNTIYRNYLVDNDQNAYDDGTDNYWDNGFIGNYWDDYSGSDADLDGIGDTPYSISGTDGGIDHLPIWFFYVLNPIFIDSDATGVGAHNWTWAAYQPWCSGSGTEIDPYVIANLTIDGMGT